MYNYENRILIKPYILWLKGLLENYTQYRKKITKGVKNNQICSFRRAGD